MPINTMYVTIHTLLYSEDHHVADWKNAGAIIYKEQI
jgi:hypothetical protein